MISLSRRAVLGGALALPALALHARAALPDRPIRLICPWGPGGTTDTYLRGIAPIVSRHLGQSLIVENRGGASGSVALGWLKSQRADGSVLAGVTDATFRIALVQSVPYEPKTDFAFLAATSTLNFGWAVLKDSPIRDLRDLVERARAQPDGLTFAGGGTPSNPPFGMKLLEHRAGAKLLFVPFASGGQMINAVMAKDVDLVFDALGALAGVIDGGTFRCLAVAAEERFPRWPEVPTAREQGFDVAVDLPCGFIAPRGLPADLTRVFEEAFRKAAEDPEHAVLIARLNLGPFWRGAAAYEAHVRDSLDALPAIYRSIGMIPS
jgi:tripartite-type tricarboxylate transporter receptor subunit TctC